MTQRRLDITVPEMLSQAETDCDVKDNVDVGARFTTRRHDCRAKLDQLVGILIEAKTDAQTLAFPGARYRQDDIGKFRGRRQVEIGLNMKIEGAERRRAPPGIGMRKQ